MRLIAGTGILAARQNTLLGERRIGSLRRNAFLRAATKISVAHKHAQNADIPASKILKDSTTGTCFDSRKVFEPAERDR